MYFHEHEFKSTDENVPDIISRFDRNLRILYVNPATAQFFGLRSGEYIGKTISELKIDKELASMLKGKLIKVFETGHETVIETNYQTPNGERYFQLQIVPEFGSDKSVETVLTISCDITMFKMTVEALRESEKRLQSVIDSIFDGLIITDERGIVETFNSAAERIFDHKADEIIGKNINLIVQEPHKKKHDEYINRFLQTDRHMTVASSGESLG